MGVGEFFPYNFLIPPFNLRGEILYTIVEKAHSFVDHGGEFYMNLYEVAKISFENPEKG